MQGGKIVEEIAPAAQIIRDPEVRVCPQADCVYSRKEPDRTTTSTPCNNEILHEKQRFLRLHPLIDPSHANSRMEIQP